MRPNDILQNDEEFARHKYDLEMSNEAWAEACKIENAEIELAIVNDRQNILNEVHRRIVHNCDGECYETIINIFKTLTPK